jgi:hypothetical protein
VTKSPRQRRFERRLADRRIAKTIEEQRVEMERLGITEDRRQGPRRSADIDKRIRAALNETPRERRVR